MRVMQDIEEAFQTNNFKDGDKIISEKISDFLDFLFEWAILFLPLSETRLRIYFQRDVEVKSFQTFFS